MVQDNSLPLPLIVQVDFEVFGKVQGGYSHCFPYCLKYLPMNLTYSWNLLNQYGNVTFVV